MDRQQQREAARSFAASKKQPVPVTLWGGEAFVKPSSWAAISALRAEHPDDDDTRMQARIIAASICDAEGVLTFNPNDEDDVAMLMDQDASFVQVVGAAMTAGSGKGSAQTTSS